MKGNKADPSQNWQDFLATLRDMRTDISQELAQLRVKRAEALLDFAMSNTPTDRAMLDALTEQVRIKTETLADVDSTIVEAERESIPKGVELCNVRNA